MATSNGSKRGQKTKTVLSEKIDRQTDRRTYIRTDKKQLLFWLLTTKYTNWNLTQYLRDMVLARMCRMCYGVKRYAMSWRQSVAKVFASFFIQRKTNSSSETQNIIPNNKETNYEKHWQIPVYPLNANNSVKLIYTHMLVVRCTHSLSHTLAHGNGWKNFENEYRQSHTHVYVQTGTCVLCVSVLV